MYTLYYICYGYYRDSTSSKNVGHHFMKCSNKLNTACDIVWCGDIVCDAAVYRINLWWDMQNRTCIQKLAVLLSLTVIIVVQWNDTVRKSHVSKKVSWWYWFYVLFKLVDGQHGRSHSSLASRRKRDRRAGRKMTNTKNSRSRSGYFACFSNRIVISHIRQKFSISELW